LGDNALGLPATFDPSRAAARRGRSALGAVALILRHLFLSQPLTKANRLVGEVDRIAGDVGLGPFTQWMGAPIGKLAPIIGSVAPQSKEPRGLSYAGLGQRFPTARPRLTYHNPEMASNPRNQRRNEAL